MSRRTAAALLLAIVSPLTLVACGDDAASPDAGVDAALTCEAPTPLVAGTPATDAVADAPARCGAPAYTWRRDATLGDVVDLGAPTEYAADFLAALLQTQDLTLPVAPTYDTASRRVTYQTQDRGELVEATALVAYPTTPVDGELDVLLFLHGTSGFTDGCGVTGGGDTYGLLAAAVASTGYVVVAPDYLGLRGDGVATGFPHPYLVGEPTAIASLDAVRAALRMAPAERGNQCASPRYAVLGGSQGGHAAMWVDRLAPYYARELDLTGVVATVPPSDILAETTRALTQIVNATGNTIAFLGTAPAWYGVTSLSGAFASPWDADLPGILASSCDPGDGIGTPTALSDVFTQPLLDAAAGGTLDQVDPFGCVIAENGLPTTSVPRLATPAASYGILNVFSEQDNLVNTPIERVAYEQLCGDGVPLQYLECAGAGHTDSTLWALSEILSFIQDRFAGVAFTPSCTADAPVTCSGTPAP
ncbi:MAG: hypothetical protein H6709_17165 [Kofleriaceae bacterium]|nr:hypothetical protein [Kofleriaceae bacterium]MCB9573813.1 hypothetical protein [Kofleriaceae bacterium]